MLLAVSAVYFPVPNTPQDNSLGGIDYEQLHSRRIRYAQEAIAAGSLPAWYSRELMGSPFWSNTQNFPFIPTRLLILTLNPVHIYAAGVQIAAALTALFTFFFCRKIGLGRLASASAGWTFACCGYFAARVLAGYLPLLEPFAGLPLLLWLVELCASSSPATDHRYAWKLGGLALASLMIALAGHPQLPMYALGAAGLYILNRTRFNLRALWPIASAMVLGVGCAAFALLPMIRLIGRSTRLLPLDDALSDVPFSYGRLLAFFFPWKDGSPAAVNPAGPPFTGYPNDAYFWDTVCYIGWVPLLAAVFLLGRQIFLRRRPAGPAQFVAVVGVLALVSALPLVADLIDKAVPGTVVRSVSRQIYVTEFALAVGLGVAIDVVGRWIQTAPSRHRAIGFSVIAVALLAHFTDLTLHDRNFVKMVAVSTDRGLPFEDRIRHDVGDGRIGMDVVLGAPFNRAVDDVGFFDSIMLAGTYSGILDLCGLPPGKNVQVMDGGEMSAQALAATGTRLVMTARLRNDLQPLTPPTAAVKIYAVPNASPRSTFLAADTARYLTPTDTHQRLRETAYDPSSQIMIPPGDYGLPPAPAGASGPAAAAVNYQRPGSDEIVTSLHANRPGFLRVLEAWDPGWTATVNGAPVDVLPADGMFLAVALPDGDYEVRFRYSTPGATAGLLLSAACVGFMAVLLIWMRRRSRSQVSTGHDSRESNPPTSQPHSKRRRRGSS